MTPDQERDRLRDAAFDEPATVHVAGLTLRNLTVRDLKRAEQLDLRILLGTREEIEALPRIRVLREATVIGWMKSRPVREVMDTFHRGQDAVEAAVDEFEEELGVELVKPLVEEVLRIVKIAQAALVELLPDPDAPGEDPVGNS